MIAKSKQKNSWFTVLLIIAATVVWYFNESRPPENPQRTPHSQTPVGKSAKA